ncbi:SUZ domain-containing protein 1 [Elsinoe australis]|uniref:SUZ domain-containing protein 1 n=1 Tax=Elsinoe australis TaxID=40998 RepID=A0A4U7ASD8_9PEZI|nr:SUZ domain-containing protein 1 [Elsinoe australis]
MSKVPDAWDDDWINSAKQSSKTATTQPKILSKSQRKAEHAEANKKIWEAAEQPDQFHYLESKTKTVPLKDEFKPQVKVLSRKPSPQVAGASNGVAGLSLQDDDSEEEERRRVAESLAERQRKAAIEREEKQRKYAEARERIMGSSASDSASRSPAGGSRQSSRRGRGGAGRGSQSGSPAEQSPARVPATQPRVLFDPGYTSRPTAITPRATTPAGEQPIRMPRGPDSSGRGGFASRGRGG